MLGEHRESLRGGLAWPIRTGEIPVPHPCDTRFRTPPKTGVAKASRLCLSIRRDQRYEVFGRILWNLLYSNRAMMDLA